MARDQRPRSDWTRQFDSVFKPRQVPGSRRGRFLIVFSLFLIGEAIFLAATMVEGQISRPALILWAVWLVACVAWILLPLAGADRDAPHNQRLARLVGMAILIAGLVARVLFADELPVWWLIGTASAAVAGAGIVLGVLELPRKD